MHKAQCVTGCARTIFLWHTLQKYNLYGCCGVPLMGATDLRDLVGLRLGSQRLSKNSPRVLLTIILLYLIIHSIAHYTLAILICILNFPPTRISCRVKPAHGRARVSVQRYGVLACSRIICRDGFMWRVISDLVTASPTFWSVLFNSIYVGHGSARGLLPNADSGVPCPQFGCKLRSSRPKFLACIFAIDLILNFSIVKGNWNEGLFLSKPSRFHHASSARVALCQRFAEVDRRCHAIYFLYNYFITYLILLIMVYSRSDYNIVF